GVGARPEAVTGACSGRAPGRSTRRLPLAWGNPWFPHAPPPWRRAIADVDLRFAGVNPASRAGHCSPSASRSPPDPLPAPLVDLFLPERDGFLQLVDRLAAGREGLRSVPRRHRDHDA